MLRVWEVHTVVAKSLRTLVNVEIRRIRPQLGLFLNASLSSRFKGLPR